MSNPPNPEIQVPHKGVCCSSNWQGTENQILALHQTWPNGLPHISVSSVHTISAVYTGIKKPESFSHSGFFVESCLATSPKHSKKPESKKPTSAAWFFETPPKFHWFFANVNARSNLAGIIRVFGHVVRDLQRNPPTAARDVMRTTRVRSKVERSRACAPLTKTQVWDSGFFAHALFVPKTPNVMGFSGSVNGTTKNPGFLDFGFCQCKWVYSGVHKYSCKLSSFTGGF